MAVGAEDSQTFDRSARVAHPYPASLPVQNAAGFMGTSRRAFGSAIIKLNIVDHRREVGIVGRQIPRDRHRLANAGRLRVKGVSANSNPALRASSVPVPL